MDNYVYHLDYPFDKIKLISEINSQELTKFSELNPNFNYQKFLDASTGDLFK